VIAIDCAREGQGLRLSIVDDGVGLPDDFSLEQAASLGLSIVSTLVGELGGSITLGRRSDGPGTRVVVKVPDVTRQPR
jgi:two-component sensor histidine kinase